MPQSDDAKREARRKYGKTYREKHRESRLLKQREHNAKWRANNPDRVAELKALWKMRNPEAANAYMRKFRAGLNEEESLRYRLHNSYRARTRAVLRRKGDKKTIEFLGCTVGEFKNHIESLFLDGMNWSNYGLNGWHIDHIIPLNSACCDHDLIPLLHYTNCRPLWAIDNLRKGAKIG